MKKRTHGIVAEKGHLVVALLNCFIVFSVFHGLEPLEIAQNDLTIRLLASGLLEVVVKVLLVEAWLET